MLLIKNANLYAPEILGQKDILIGGGKVLSIEDSIENHAAVEEVFDAEGRMLTPGFIDQHIHLIGAGGKRGFAAMTSEIKIEDLIACGTTTAVGLLGTDGTARSIKTLFAKVNALCQEGISAYMFSGYYGLDPVHLMDSLQEDMVFIDKILGCKIAISDIRSSYPTALELVRLLRAVKVGGMLSQKKGILHLHLGSLKSKMDVIFELVEEYEFPIEHISPTHVARTGELFDEAIRFAKMGGMIDITTGASKFAEPHQAVLKALSSGVEMDRMTFSSDGGAGLDELDPEGNFIGIKSAPIDQNFKEVLNLINTKEICPAECIKLITLNPAKNLGLKNKGHLFVGADADVCVLNNDYSLHSVFALGQKMMEDGKVLVKSITG